MASIRSEKDIEEENMREWKEGQTKKGKRDEKQKERRKRWAKRERGGNVREKDRERKNE